MMARRALAVSLISALSSTVFSIERCNSAQSSISLAKSDSSGNDDLIRPRVRFKVVPRRSV